MNQSWSGDGISYLEFYYHCAIPNLSNRFDNGFWSRTVLQMARAEPSVQHALIALGYLAKTEPGSLKHAHARLRCLDNTLNRHYSKAVSSLVKRMSEHTCSIEVGLVSCLLFVCIEFFRGNFLTAFSHLHSGLRIISEIPAVQAHGMYTSDKGFPALIFVFQACVPVHHHHLHQQLAQLKSVVHRPRTVS